METQVPAVSIVDTPKQQVSWLEYFPPDIWVYLACKLSGEELARLKMTGATLLWRRLKSPGVVKSIQLGRDSSPFKSRPQCLDDFSSLEELMIHSSSDDWSRQFGLTMDSIPPGVRKLELSGGWKKSIANLFGEPGTTLDLCKYLPRLESLRLMGSYDPNYSWMPHSPQSLTSLRLCRWDGAVELPSSLIHFEADSVVLSAASFVSKLPPSLESFEAISRLHGIDLVIPLLPASTHTLRTSERVFHSAGSGFLEEFLEHLPKSLTVLTLPDSSGKNFETHPELMSHLPPTLTELEIQPNFPPSVWHLLPRNLTKLFFFVPESLGTEYITEDDQIQCKVVPVPFEALPRSITSLEMFSFGAEDQYFCAPPTASHQSYFPPQLTSLTIPKIQLAPETAKLLPSSLTDLVIGNFCERVCENLPTGLKTLTTTKTLMSPNLIKFLPKSLTSLQLSISGDADPWFDYKTGESIDSISDLPEYSIHEDCMSEDFDWTDTSPLPPTLTYLEILGAYELGDSFLHRQRLPKLCDLRLPDSEYFSDISIPLLSPYLSSLNLSSSSDISGKSFPLLPRYLSSLYLSSSESIFDSDIEHLPRTLKMVGLSSAIHLTDLCIPDLPPHLTHLLLDHNTNISGTHLSSLLFISLPIKYTPSSKKVEDKTDTK